MQTMTELGGHDLHLSVRQRALIVNAVLVEGKSYRAVARELGLHHKTVSNTINKFNESHDLHEHPSGVAPQPMMTTTCIGSNASSIRSHQRLPSGWLS
jgi:transposase-like protein